MCVFSEQCIRMQISTCWMTHSVLWMLRWESTCLKSKSRHQHPSVEKSSGKYLSANLMLFVMLIKNICCLQVHLWTIEEETSHPGYSSTTISEGCRSNCGLKGGVCMCVYIYVFICKVKCSGGDKCR